MEYNNKMIELAKNGGIDKETLETAVILLAPFIPHVAEELWSQLGHTASVFKEKWPEHDEDKMKDNEIEIAVQVNGKTKSVVMVGADEAKELVIAKAKEVVADKLTGTIVKEIYVPGKIVNLVVK
jgi:leucyl-tRNA synthetase